MLVTGDYEQVEPISPALAVLPLDAPEAPAHSAEACPNFSEPEGWFLGSEPRTDSGAPTVDAEEGHALPVQGISSPFPGHRKAD
jgi:hypothetical protein